MAFDRSTLATVAKQHANAAPKPAKSGRRTWNPFASLFTAARGASAVVVNAQKARQTAAATPKRQAPSAVAGLAPIKAAHVPHGGKATQSDAATNTPPASSLSSSPSIERAAVAAERARCARIIAHGIATGTVHQAGAFAFDTDLDVDTAIAALDAGRADNAKPRTPTLGERMAHAQVPNPGAGAEAAPLTTAQAIVVAGMKCRGEI